jgi:hypothetical protein
MVGIQRVDLQTFDLMPQYEVIAIVRKGRPFIDVSDGFLQRWRARNRLVRRAYRVAGSEYQVPRASASRHCARNQKVPLVHSLPVRSDKKPFLAALLEQRVIRRRQLKRLAQAGERKNQEPNRA